MGILAQAALTRTHHQHAAGDLMPSLEAQVMVRAVCSLQLLSRVAESVPHVRAIWSLTLLFCVRPSFVLCTCRLLDGFKTSIRAVCQLDLRTTCQRRIGLLVGQQDASWRGHPPASPKLGVEFSSLMVKLIERYCYQSDVMRSERLA